jgi:DNA-binding transcriptional MerR regulator
MTGPSLPEKPYYRIGEVAKFLGVEPYVLRFWESEFPQIRPRRAPSRHRIYLPEDVRLLALIQNLVHDKGYTLAGARRRLEEMAADQKAKKAKPPSNQILGELKDILKMLD